MGTIELLMSMDIDILVLPSMWEETFCLTAYEALAAGVEVLCFDKSGNLSALSENLESIKKFNDLDGMYEYIKDLSTKKDFLKKLYKLEDCMNLEYLDE